MPEIELYCYGVRVKVFKHIIDEFNDHRFMLVNIHDGDNVPPALITAINNFCIAKQQTKLIIDQMKAAA